MKHLVLACGLLLVPFSAAHAKPADCLVEVRGHTLLSGLCEFTAIPGGHFQVSSYEDNGYAPETFVSVIITQKDVARGFWNGSRYQPEAEAPLGALIRSKRDRACWENRNATVCAW